MFGLHLIQLTEIFYRLIFNFYFMCFLKTRGTRSPRTRVMEGCESPKESGAWELNMGYTRVVHVLNY